MSDELSGALRELAAQHETPPRVGAAEIRDRAGRRSRRRRATVVLGTVATAVCALTAVAFTLHTDEPGRTHRTPAATSDTPAPSPATPVPASAGVLDLGRHTLTVGERVIRVDSHSFGRFPPGSRMTVVARYPAEVLPLGGDAKVVGEVKVPYLVELRTPDREPVYAGGLTFDAKALAALPADTGWLGMGVRDAEWFYTRTRPGDRIEITSTVVPTAPETTTPPTGAETAARSPGAANRVPTPGAAGS